MSLEPPGGREKELVPGQGLPL